MTKNDKIEAMMVLEFLTGQQNDAKAATGLDDNELAWLAHHILQNGVDGLPQDMQHQLAHLHGTLKKN